MPPRFSYALHFIRKMCSSKQPQPTRRRPDLADLINPTHRPLELRMIPDTRERTACARGTVVYRRVRRTADVEVRELVEVDVDCVGGVAFANGLDLAGLCRGEVSFGWGCLTGGETHAFFKFSTGPAINKRIREAQRSAVLLVLVREVHSREERESLVCGVDIRDGEVGGELEAALLNVVREGREVGTIAREFAALKLDGHG